MATNSNNGGESDSDLASIALPGLKLVTSKNPRMLKPFEIDLLGQDLQAGLERDEEAEAITRERQAFRRYQAAMAAANRLFVPQADGVPTASINGDSMARIDAEAAGLYHMADSQSELRAHPG